MGNAWKIWSTRFLLGIALGALCGAFVSGLTDAPSRTVRVSLLETPGEIRSMSRILKRHMAEPGEVRFIRKAMEARAGSPDQAMDTKAFFMASSTEDAAEYLRRFPADPERLGWQINCFDAMLIVTNHFLTHAETSLPEPVFIGQVESPIPSFDPKKYQEALFHEDGWLAERYQSCTGQARSERSLQRDRILFSRLPVPGHVRSGGLDVAALQSVLDTHWATHGITFPKEMGLVLFHNVSWGGFWIETLHTGVLLPRRNGFVYFEKMGGFGPFVRVDLNRQSELPELMAYRHEGNCRFLSVNGQIIGHVPHLDMNGFQGG